MNLITNKYIIVSAVICFICTGAYWLGLPSCYFPFWSLGGSHDFGKGEVVKPLDSLDFSDGRWEAYVTIHIDDYEFLSPRVRKAMCLRSDDIELFKRMQKEWLFSYGGGDLATVQSSIHFLKDNILVFQSDIVLDDSREGLQSTVYGWLEAEPPLYLSDYIKHFKRVYWPYRHREQ